MKRILVYPVLLTFSIFQKTGNVSNVLKRMKTHISTRIKYIHFDVFVPRKISSLLYKSDVFIPLFEYLFSAIICISCLSIVPCMGLIKIFIILLLILLLIFPITRIFFRPSLPIISWLILFYACRFIPSSMRPHIWVTILPTLENILYGDRLSDLLSNYTYFFLDILAWIPYGIIHFGAPFVTAVIIYLSSPPGTLPVFAKSFGYLNLIGVIIQLAFPCSPPWYRNVYGSQPANYNMEGSAGGLARIDGFFGTKVYTSAFPASPLVFGAFPSLHSGHATLEALFLSYIFPKITPYLVIYVLWLWWCTMYLTHHYFVDLIGGSCLAIFIFYIAQYNYLPHMQSGNLFRWDHKYTICDLSRIDDSVIPFSNPSLGRYKSLENDEMFEITGNDHIYRSCSLSSVWSRDIVDFINAPNSMYDIEECEDIDIIVK